MKLSNYAKQLGITYRTAWNHFRKGLIPNAFTLPSGTIIVPELSPQPLTQTKKVCIYTRVSSSQNKTNLDAQADRLQKYCTSNGWQIVRIIKEVASGLNDHRPQLADVIEKLNEYDLVIVEHKDRLTRIGFNYFELLAPNKFHVVNLSENKTEDLMIDLVAIITSFCARLYGQRKGKRKTLKLIEELNKSDT